MFHRLVGTAIVLSLIACVWAFPANAQSVTSKQLQSLALDEKELQGFFRVVPKGEFLQPEVWSQQDQKWGQQEATAIPAQDYVLTNQKADCQSPFWRPLTEQSGSYSIMDRCLWSADGRYQVEMSVALCDSTATAHNELKEIRQQSQIALTPGTLSNRVQLGDESWVYPVSNEKVIRGCCGRLLYMVSGEPSQLASRAGTALEFPSEAVEAVVYQMLLRASEQSELTGVTVQQVSLGVNGHVLPKNALRVAGQTYVPVVEFAKAMGLTSHWDTKTGALTLSGTGHKTVALTAGSTENTVGGAKAAALTVPVLKQAGQPVMALADLLVVTGGRIVSHTGNAMQIKG